MDATLLAACRVGDIDEVRQILNRNPELIPQPRNPRFSDVDFDDENDMMFGDIDSGAFEPLAYAITSKNLPLLQVLIEEFGFDLSSNIPIGLTNQSPLEVAVMIESEDVLKYLLEQCRLLLHTRLVESAFVFTMRRGRCEMGSVFLEVASDMINFESFTHSLVLNNFANELSERSTVAVVEWLIDNNIYLPSSVVCTMLHWFLSESYTDACTILMNHYGVPEFWHADVSYDAFGSRFVYKIDAFPWIHASSAKALQQIAVPRMLPLLQHPFPVRQCSTFINDIYSRARENNPQEAERWLSVFIDRYIVPDPRVLIYSYPFAAARSSTILDALVENEYYEFLPRAVALLQQLPPTLVADDVACDEDIDYFCSPHYSRYCDEWEVQQESIDPRTRPTKRRRGKLLQPGDVLARLQSSFLLQYHEALSCGSIDEIRTKLSEVSGLLQKWQACGNSRAQKLALIDPGYCEDGSVGGVRQTWLYFSTEDLHYSLHSVGVKAAIRRGRLDIYHLFFSADGKKALVPWETIAEKSSYDRYFAFASKIRLAVKTSQTAFIDHFLSAELTQDSHLFCDRHLGPLLSDAFWRNDVAAIHCLLAHPTTSAVLSSWTPQKFSAWLVFDYTIKTIPIKAVDELLEGIQRFVPLRALLLKSFISDPVHPLYALDPSRIDISHLRVLHKYRLLLIGAHSGGSEQGWCARVSKWLTNMHVSGGLHEEVLEMMLDEAEHNDGVDDVPGEDARARKISWLTMVGDRFENPWWLGKRNTATLKAWVAEHLRTLLDTP